MSAFVFCLLLPVVVRHFYDMSVISGLVPVQCPMIFRPATEFPAVAFPCRHPVAVKRNISVKLRLRVELRYVDGSCVVTASEVDADMLRCVDISPVTCLVSRDTRNCRGGTANEFISLKKTNSLQTQKAG